MKKNNKRKFVLIIAVVICVIVLISCALFLWYLFSGNYIKYGLVDNTAENVPIADAKGSDAIIVNGIVLGATKNGKWIDANSYYNAKNSEASIEVKMFSENNIYGVYKTASIRRHSKYIIYTTIAKEGLPNKYIAISNTEKSTNTLPGMTKLDATKQDEQYVKEALGSYKLVNGSVKITEVYAANISQTTDRIICATSAKANLMGVYSIVVYVTQNNAYLVKYSYVKDTENSERWPIYSLQFVMDLNYDLKPELVLQEITGNDISYSVLEKREDNKFYQVLKTTVEIADN